MSISIQRLAKNYGNVWALNGVNTTIEMGEVRGLLGANGSGKSTLMKILLGLVRPDNGLVTVEEINPAINPIAVREIIGYVPETPRLYDFLSGIEYLDFVADLHGLATEVKKQRIDEYLSAFDLKEQGNDLISGYSMGMRQKIAIAAALIHKPRVLIFDEALNGLDPRTAKIVKDTIIKLASDGVTVLFSTHVLEIAEAICKKITILDKGRILAEGSMGDLRSRASETNLESIFLALTGSSDVRAIVEEITR
ncbi:MAG: ABC transporter ATP-binding protein [Nitrososphaerota archaeon]|nr:ABC transporter ATP-binding protein [Nitrososphaerota archaeon]